MSESKPSHVVLIVVAIIGLFGTLGAAMIANWDKMFPHNPNAASIRPEDRSPSSAIPQETQIAGATTPTTAKFEEPPSPESPDIDGLWIDMGAPQNRSEITQTGKSFRFTRNGTLPNDVRFYSEGKGEIDGRYIKSTYSTIYFTGRGDSSDGECSGTISPNWRRIDINCTDSSIGSFSISSVRN